MKIQKLQIVPLPRDQYASFYNGDSYIIYSASEPNQPGGMNVKVIAYHLSASHMMIHVTCQASFKKCFVQPGSTIFTISAHSLAFA